MQMAHANGDPARGGSAAATPPDAALPSLEQKVGFLQSLAAHPALVQAPAWQETHMSWLFFAGDLVLKLKKPVRFAFLDFSTLRAREFYCREELRLNARLAPGVYLGLCALQASDAGLALVREAQMPQAGDTVDWLVCMRRLPRQRMLDDLLARGCVRREDIDALVAVLGAFYRQAPAVQLSGPHYLARVQHEQGINRAVLLQPQFDLRDAGAALDRLDAALAQRADLLYRRADSGRVVDGHGDLRPEHVCMLAPPVVIDCLEFNPQLRQVDPFDEIAYLSLECAMAGADWVGPQLLLGCVQALGEPAVPELMQLYTAHRALLRARLAMAHLLEPQPRMPQRWAPLARRYIACALRATGPA